MVFHPLMNGGAAAILLLLLLRLAAAATAPTPDLDGDPPLLHRHEAILSRLESLLSRLEALYPPPSPSPSSSLGLRVISRRSQWSDRFHFAAAVSAQVAVTAAAVLPLSASGASRFIAAGDSLGRLFLFSAAGDVVATLHNATSSPISAILTYLVPSHRSDCLIFSGHLDGTVVLHRISESVDEYVPASSDVASRVIVSGGHDASAVTILESYTLGRSRYVISVDASGRIRVFTEDGTLYGTAIATHRPIAFAPRNKMLFLTEAGASSLDLRSMTVRNFGCDGVSGPVLPMAYTFDPLERSKAYGFTSEGDLLHVVLLGDVTNLKCRVRAVRRGEIKDPIAIQALKGYLLVAGQDRVHVYNTSSQQYRTAGAPRPLFAVTLKEIKSVFAGSDVVASGGVGVSTGKPIIAADREKLVVLGLGDGYIAVYHSNFPVFRTESNAVVWTGPALLFLLFLIGIWQVYTRKKDSFVLSEDGALNNSLAMDPSGSLLNQGAGDRPFADAVRAGERPFTDGGARAGERPFVDAVRAAERPFADAARTGERTFADGARTGERGFTEGARTGDLVAGALRVTPRRYISPPRYAGASGIPYRPVAADPILRGPAELKYRGPGMEPPGFPKRRDPLFNNNQAVGDHTD